MIDQSDDLLNELLQPAITFPADVTLTTLGFNISNSIAIENVPQRNRKKACNTKEKITEIQLRLEIKTLVN